MQAKPTAGRADVWPRFKKIGAIYLHIRNGEVNSVIRRREASAGSPINGQDFIEPLVQKRRGAVILFTVMIFVRHASERSKKAELFAERVSSETESSA
jgi:hypothetical protein